MTSKMPICKSCGDTGKTTHTESGEFCGDCEVGSALLAKALGVSPKRRNCPKCHNFGYSLGGFGGRLYCSCEWAPEAFARAEDFELSQVAEFSEGVLESMIRSV